MYMVKIYHMRKLVGLQEILDRYLKVMVQV